MLPPVNPTGDLARLIDQTLLRPEATEAEIQRLCEEARELLFACICIHPCHVTLAARLLEGSGVGVCTVVGFPLGANLPETKGTEARLAVEQGATEIDMVYNLGALRSGHDDLVSAEIRRIVEVAQPRALVKVILETALLTESEIVRACLLAQEAGAGFVKTSTGFGPGGATAQHVALMRRTVGSAMGVKASGGIRSRAAAEAMLRAGASRIGTSHGARLVRGD